MMHPTRNALRLLPSRRSGVQQAVSVPPSALRSFHRSYPRLAETDSSKEGAQQQQQQQQQHQEQEGQEQQQQEQQGQRQKQQRNENQRSPGQSPYQVFVETLKSELTKNKQHQENVRQLGGEVSKLPGAQWTRGMYENMRLTASIRNNPRLRAAAEEMRKNGVKVSDAVADAVKSVEESSYYKSSREAFERASAAVSSATEPIRQTEAYQTVSTSVFEALDDVTYNSRYGGFVDRETRRKRRMARLSKLGKHGMATGGMAPANVQANPQAGENVVLHSNATKKSRLSSVLPESLRDRLASLSDAYNTSENLFVATARGFTSTVSRMFDENEQAKVIRWAKTLDPTFQSESFLHELREYVVPEIVDAFVSGDFGVLREWCSEATFNVLTAAIEPYLKQGLVPDSRVLDIREVDIKGAKILENDIPVFIIDFRTQEILTFRDPKTGEVIAGDENKIESCVYAAVMTREVEHMDNEVTGGWKIIDMARRAI